MNARDLQITNTYFVERASFVNLFKEGNFQLQPSITKKIKLIDERTFDVSLKFEVKNSDECPFPFDIELVVTLRSHFDKEILKDKELDEFLNITCVGMLYPYLRTCVTNLCTTSLVSPIILPVADVKKILKEE